jgi:molybdopterin converting factor small subunit
MIRVRCLGHIGTSVGASEVEIEGESVPAAELVDRVRTLAGARDPGFTKYNTLVMVEEGEAFVSAGSDRKVKGGEKVVLIPFSHGG